VADTAAQPAKPSRATAAPAPVTALGATPVCRETRTAATATTVNSAPVQPGTGSSVPAPSARSARPTTRQTHAATQSPRPQRAITAAPAAAMPNSTPTMMPYRRMAPGSLSAEPPDQIRHAYTAPTTATIRLGTAPTISGDRHLDGGFPASARIRRTRKPRIRADTTPSRVYCLEGSHRIRGIWVCHANPEPALSLRSPRPRLVRSAQRAEGDDVGARRPETAPQRHGARGALGVSVLVPLVFTIVAPSRPGASSDRRRCHGIARLLRPRAVRDGLTAAPRCRPPPREEAVVFAAVARAVPSRRSPAAGRGRDGQVWPAAASVCARCLRPRRRR
jgi:hypothetical protein